MWLRFCVKLPYTANYSLEINMKGKLMLTNIYAMKVNQV